jgi:hypothetical protein
MCGVQPASTHHGRRIDLEPDPPSAARSWSQSATPRTDVREIGGYRTIEARGGTLPSGASGAGELIADRVGEIIARRQFEQALIRLEIARYDADSVSPQGQALSARAPGTGDAAVNRRRLASLSRAAATVARRPGSPRRAPSARTAPPDEGSHFALASRLRSDVAPFERRG